MSIKLMSLVWQDHTNELTGIEKSVLIRMADFAADNGTQIFPSIKTLSLDTGFCETAVKQAIKGLEQKKRITKTKRSRKLQHITNLYKINVQVLQAKTEPNKNPDYIPVNKSVKKSGITQGGGSSHDPGVGRHTTQGGSSHASNPPQDPSHRSTNSYKEQNKIEKKIEYRENRKKLLDEQLKYLTNKMKR